MPSLLKRAKDIELKLHALVAEVRELKDELREMEEENSRLRTELAAVYREGCPAQRVPVKRRSSTGGLLTCWISMTRNIIFATCTSAAGGWANASSAWLF